MSASELEETIKLIKTSMRFLGVWPDEKRKFFSKLRFAFIYSFIFFALVLPQSVQLIYAEKNLNDIIEILTNLLVMLFISWCKLLNELRQGQAFKNLVEVMRQDWRVEDETKREVMLKSIIFPKFMVRFSFASVAGSGITYTIYRLLYIVFSASDSSERLLYVTSKFFFDTQSSPGYEVLWCSQCVATCIAVLPYAVYESFFIVLVYHASTQLHTLRLDIRNLSVKVKQGSFAAGIRSVVERHLELKEFSNKIEDMYCNIFLMKMVLYSIVICLQGYQLMILTDLRNVASVLFIVVFLGATIFSVFINCFVAEKLRDESTKIFDEVYNVSWYDLRPKEAGMLIVVMCASKAPFELTAGKFIVLSLEYFMDVLKTAGGYLSLLFTLKDE